MRVLWEMDPKMARQRQEWPVPPSVLAQNWSLVRVTPRNDRELRDLVDALEVDMANELLDHDCWIVAQWWVSPDGDKLGLGAYGTFTTQLEALDERDRVQADAEGASRPWRAKYGEPRVEVIPVFPPTEEIDDLRPNQPKEKN